MALFIPYRCPKCFESVTLIQPLDKQDMPKGKAQGHCVICGWREEVAIYPNQKIYAGPTYPKLECGGPGLPRRLLVPLPKLITRGLPFPTIKKRPKV